MKPLINYTWRRVTSSPICRRHRSCRSACRRFSMHRPCHPNPCPSSTIVFRVCSSTRSMWSPHRCSTSFRSWLPLSRPYSSNRTRHCRCCSRHSFFVTRFEVGLVPTTTFQSKPRGRDFFSQTIFPALGASCQCCIRHSLNRFELVFAALTHVLIDRHLENPSLSSIHVWPMKKQVRIDVEKLALVSAVHARRIG